MNRSGLKRTVEHMLLYRNPISILQYQSSLLSPDGSYNNVVDPNNGFPCFAQPVPTGPINQYSYSIITTQSGFVGVYSLARAMSSWQSAYTFQINVNQNNVNAIVQQVVDSACVEPSCSCPEGYALIYPDLVSSPVIWNQETGDCESFVLDNLGQPGNGQSLAARLGGTVHPGIPPGPSRSATG